MQPSRLATANLHQSITKFSVATQFVLKLGTSPGWKCFVKEGN
jgi:hypothetical protein